MITRLTLVCHAPTAALRAAAFPADEPIEPRGRAEAAALGSRLGRAPLVWSGPEARCRETAEAMGLAAAPLPALRDCAYGAWAGRRMSDIEQAEPAALLAWLGDPEAAPHGGESLASLLGRTASWLDGLGEAGHVIAITHAAIIRAAILHAAGAAFPSFWRFDIAPLSVTDLRRGPQRWTVRSTGCGAPDGAEQPG